MEIRFVILHILGIKVKTRKSYNGGKGGSGVYQKIINQMPPHRVYIETHLGSGQVMRHKRPATYNLAIDLDESLLTQLSDVTPEILKTHCGDATVWLSNMISASGFSGDELIYADPPYLHTTRKRENYYKYEMTEAQHIDLLETLKRLPCYVIISGYWSDLYADLRQGWRTHRFQAMTRQGPATEWLWMNYPQPTALHDYQYLGGDYRERERIKRKITRWKTKLASLPLAERYAMLSALNSSIDASSYMSRLAKETYFNDINNISLWIGYDEGKGDDITAVYNQSVEIKGDVLNCEFMKLNLGQQAGLRYETKHSQSLGKR